MVVVLSCRWSDIISQGETYIIFTAIVLYYIVLYCIADVGGVHL